MYNYTGDRHRIYALEAQVSRGFSLLLSMLVLAKADIGTILEVRTFICSEHISCCRIFTVI